MHIERATTAFKVFDVDLHALVLRLLLCEDVAWLVRRRAALVLVVVILVVVAVVVAVALIVSVYFFYFLRCLVAVGIAIDKTCVFFIRPGCRQAWLKALPAIGGQIALQQREDPLRRRHHVGRLVQPHQQQLQSLLRRHLQPLHGHRTPVVKKHQKQKTKQKQKLFRIPLPPWNVVQQLRGAKMVRRNSVLVTIFFFARRWQVPRVECTSQCTEEVSI